MLMLPRLRPNDNDSNDIGNYSDGNNKTILLELRNRNDMIMALLTIKLQ